MGVKDLWKLLETAGRPVTLESLEGLVLAVDVSIWLNQAVKGARDRHGDAVTNAHLVVLFNRICKLLYYHIKPVFVFDGATPALKQQTLAARSQRRESASQRSLRAADKQMSKFLQSKILEQLTGQKSSIPAPMASTPPQSDIFQLPPLPEAGPGTEKTPFSEKSPSPGMEGEGGAGAYLRDVVSLDIHSEEFDCLPPEVQHELLVERQQLEKYSHSDPSSLPQVANDFSSYQLSQLMKRSRINQKLEGVRKVLKSDETAVIGLGEESKVHEVETSRILSSDSAHYILVRGTDMESSSQEDSLSQESMELSEIEEWKPDLVRKEDGGKEHLKGKEESHTVLKPSRKKIKTVTSGLVATIPFDSDRVQLVQQKDTAMPENVLSTEDQQGDAAAHGGSLSLPEEANAKGSAGVGESRDLTACYSETTNSGKEVAISVSEIHEVERTNIPTRPSTQFPEISLEHTTSLRAQQECEDISAGETPEVELETQTRKEEADRNTWRISPCTQTEQPESPDGSRSHLQERAESKEEAPRSTEGPKISSTHVEAESVGAVRENREGGDGTNTVETTVERPPVVDNDSTAGSQQAESTTREVWRTSELPTSSEVLEVQETSEQLVGPAVHEEQVLARHSTTTASGEISIISDSESEGEEHSVVAVEEAQVVEDSGMELRPLPAVEWTGGSEVEALLDLSPEEAQSQLQLEAVELERERAQQARVAATVSSQMYREVQELLSLFGLPYIVSPTEAEAQCAALDMANMTQGTITDDSDVFLFGGRRVYRHFFSQERHVEFYSSEEIQQRVGLSRDRLVVLAYLLGSDYTGGLEGVGPVSALEFLREFPGDGLEPLRKFREWYKEVNSKPALTIIMGETTLQKKLRQLSLPPSFPNEAVWEAYLHPEVDCSSEPFLWGRPDLDLIRRFSQERMGWSQRKVDETLLPVLRRMNTREAQQRITKFLPMVAVSPSQKKSFTSKRMRHAVARLTNTETVPVHKDTGGKRAPESVVRGTRRERRKTGVSTKRKRTELSSSGSSSDN